ncbi:MAG: NAD-dependent succinate-semialdehyde dehydrogenase [Bacteroidales bacterium]|nr:NAD-dependent succinate-semialdehyde dehydrogenase [Bacteroidales bacterium]
MAYRTFNPYTCKEEARFNFISKTEFNEKLKLAESSFHHWKDTALEERSSILLKVAELLEKEEEKHAKLITTEMGKPISQSRMEVSKCAWVSRYYAEKAAEFLAPVKMESTAQESYIRFDPLGIIFAVMPWNFPYWQVFRYIAPNFMAGNTGLLKHASNVPLCAIAMEQIFLDAGAPEGIFQNLLINYDQVSQVIKHPGVRGITLTGSNYAGYKVAELAGTMGKKTVLELGGSDPYVIFADADLENAAETGIMARFQNNGQSCIAAKRFIVQEEVFDSFLALFREKVEALKVGDPMDPETVIGPVARKDLLLELENQLRHIVVQGGKILTGGRRHSPKSLILKPTIITDLPIDARINQDELFGPIIPVFSFKTEEEAVQMANNTPFGLAASVWTGSRERADRIAPRIESGTVAINGMVKSEPNLPFGGVKASGFGRELSEIGMHEFLNVKTVSYF